MHQTQSSRYLIGFSYENSAGRRYRHCFLLNKSSFYLAEVSFYLAKDSFLMFRCVEWRYL
jgi:hypothetical protein